MKKIKKILIVPSGRVVRYEDDLLYAPFLSRFVEKIKSKTFTRPTLYDAETQYYGDIPDILGKENSFVFGVYRPNVLWKKAPKDCPYLSTIGNPEPTFFTSKEKLTDVLRQVDAVLVSARAGVRGEVAIQGAKKSDVPIAILDHTDQPEVYTASKEDIFRVMFRGFKPREHFDAFFKTEIPLGRASDIIFPLAPIPVRPASFVFSTLPKDQDIFFSGRPRVECHGDRKESAEFVQKNFPGAAIFLHGSKNTFFTVRESNNHFARSKMALSPSGISWGSTRHTEIGLAPDTLLIAPKPFVETTGPELKDGENALLYDTELRNDGKYHLVKEEELLRKIRYYIMHDDERIRVSRNWKMDVLSGHTVWARSQYILDSLATIL